MFFLAILFILSGCSRIPLVNSNTGKDDSLNFRGFEYYEQEDYTQHFEEFEKFYLASESVANKKLNYRQKIYLEKLADNIIKNNELFFITASKAKFYVINSSTPFHFSLPGRKIFFSSGLIKKYLKSENTLYCLLTYELIRSEKKIYHKTLIIPTGTINTTRMLSIMRLTTAEKVEIHKWAFYILKRLGIDTDNYLSWIQIQNRNSTDFMLQLGDMNSISREESLFKMFLINNTKESAMGKKYSGSSREFYSFINGITK
jgi:hypothetical protein